MKNVNILIIALLFSAISLQAATLVVNNSIPNVVGEYTSVQTAIDAAANNDVILIKGTVTNYGSFYVTKPLTIVGNGYKPATVSANSTKCDYVYLPNNTAHDIKILGLDCTGVISQGNNDNITVEFCRLSYRIEIGGSTNQDWVISNCIFPSGSSTIYGINPSNVLIEHCYINGGIQLGSAASNIIIQYNVFAHNSGQAAFGLMGNAVIVNNIFYASTLFGYNSQFGYCSFTGCIISRNLTYNVAGTSIAPTNTCNPSSGLCNTGNSISDNVVNTNPNFVSFTLGDYTSAMDLRLQAGSAALTAGAPATIGGPATQIGLYGNGFDFSTTGEPRIPAVRSISIANPSTNSGVGSTLNVTITASKARAN
jgi:hypothetical protein